MYDTFRGSLFSCRQVTEVSSRVELQVEEEVVDGGDELSEYQDEGPDAKPPDVLVVLAEEEDFVITCGSRQRLVSHPATSHLFLKLQA